MGSCITQTKPITQQAKSTEKKPSPPPMEQPKTERKIGELPPKIAIEFPKLTPTPTRLVKYTAECLMSHQELMKVKVPTSTERTTFTWMEEPTIFFTKKITEITREEIRYGTFQQKLSWFRINLEKKRISWQDGSDELKVDRWNILFSSIDSLKKVNLYKELKIDFNDEVVHDAGGLLREWMHLCVKEIMSPDYGIFQQCVTDETAYKISWDRDLIDELVSGALELLGLIIGKAIFQRISLNCYLNKTLIRHICGQPIHFCDVYSYDKDLYNNWRYLLENKESENLSLNFCLYHTHSTANELEEIELIPNGSGILVNEANKHLYLEKMISLYCFQNVQNYIAILVNTIHSVIPVEYLSIFQPEEFEMILNGPSEIDIQNWKENTIYENFEEHDDLKQWFWEEVQQYSQKEFKNLLHYCTGSTRVPVLGFKYLESNRGEIRKFTLRKVEYNKDNPYPKAYTCFNRLELPAFESLEQLGNRMRLIMVEEFNHFGFD